MNSNGVTVKNQMINTRYFGSNNELAPGNHGSDLRQVPIVHIADLDYDAYSVEVQFVWMKALALLPTKGDISIPGIAKADYEFIGFDGSALRGEEPNTPQFDVYVDAVRVYKPIDTAVNAVASRAYAKAGELNPTYTEIRQILVNGGAQFNGAVAIDIAPHQVPVIDEETGKPVIDEETGKPVMDFVMPQNGNFEDLAVAYKNWGPNNEMYLMDGQGFAFKLDGEQIAASQLHISAKSPFGDSMTMKVHAIVNGAERNDLTREIPVTSSTEMFFDLTDVLSGVGSSNNVYIVITVTGSGVLSVCQMKTISSERGISFIANETALELVAAVIGGTKGDVNADASIDMMDALLTMRTSLGSDMLGVYGTFCADMNNDGAADIQDALAIIRAATDE